MMPDMVGYLERHALVYESPPVEGFEGVPLGNGAQSAMVWHTARSLEVHLNHSDAYDATGEGTFRAWSWEGEERQSAQVSAGHLCIEDGLPSFDKNYLGRYHARLDLGRASFHVESETPFSRWRLDGFFSRDPAVLVIDAEISSEEEVERRVRLERWDTRSFTHYYEQYVEDPSIRLSGMESGTWEGAGFVSQRLSRTRIAVAAKIQGDGVSIHRLHGRAVELRTVPARESRFRLLVSCAAGGQDEDLVGRTVEDIRRAEADPEGLRARHLARWSDFWDRSFVRLPEADDYLENLYYVHFYSLFSCGLGRLPPGFTGGGWTWNGDVRNWGHLYHWNQQQLLWALDAAGRPELAENYHSFCRGLLPRALGDARRLFGADGAFFSDIASADGDQAIEPDTIRNLTVGPQIALSLFDHFLYTGDLDFLKGSCMPVLEACVSFYRSMLRHGEDGVFRISGGSTPYESYWNLKETLTDGCAVRALARVLRKAEAALGITEAALGAGAPNDADFQELAGALPELTIVAARNVFSAGRKWDGSIIDFEEGKYPYSAFPATLLAPIFPFAIIGLDDEGSALSETARETMRLFLDTNVYRLGAYGASGHTPVPQAAARLGMGEDALAALRLFARRYQRFPNGFMHYASRQDGHFDGGRGYFTPRVLSGQERETRYEELHDKSKGERRRLDSSRFLHMYYETSSNIAAGIQEMLLQSHEGSVRVFPAFPDSGDAAFSLHARGGFLVSSEKRSGSILYVSILARRAGTFSLRLPWKGSVTLARGSADPVTLDASKPCIELDMAEGESVVVYPACRPLDSYYSIPILPLKNEAPKHFGEVSLGKARDF